MHCILTQEEKNWDRPHVTAEGQCLQKDIKPMDKIRKNVREAVKKQTANCESHSKKGRFYGQYNLLRINFIKMILAELDAGTPVCRVELVWNVPAKRSELPSFLQSQAIHCQLTYFTYITICKNMLQTGGQISPLHEIKMKNYWENKLEQETGKKKK